MQVQEGEHNEADDHSHYHGTLDAIRKILKEDGPSGLYTGLFGGLVGVAFTNFAYFYWYAKVRDAYQKRNPQIGTAMELALGAIAGALAQIFTLPISVVNTRQQTSKKGDRKSLFGTARDVVKEDGISGLWRGLRPSLVLTINPSITYGLFERIKEAVYPNVDRLSPGQSFCVGAISKTIATIVTYPYIMAKVRMQHKYQPPREPISTLDDENQKIIKTSDGAIQILNKIYKKNGVLGLYKGINQQITKAVLTQAILFYFKEVFTRYTIILFAVMYRLRTKLVARLSK